MAKNKNRRNSGAAGKTEAAKRGGMNSGGNPDNLPNVDTDINS